MQAVPHESLCPEQVVRDFAPVISTLLICRRIREISRRSEFFGRVIVDDYWESTHRPLCLRTLLELSLVAH